MKTEKNKKIGVLIMFLGLAGSFFLFEVFHLYGVALDFKNVLLLFKIIFAIAFLLFGLYFGLLFYGGKKIANQIGIGLSIFLVISFLVGGLLH
jgi:hypothetical protein